MKQIAEELNIGLVSYSMTHHTRQSALGLPMISKKIYKGNEYEISEYTMSEIIASVHEVIEKSGINEGILFLDEINCVSETLAPSMLQFLQYKVFGNHKVPNGFIIVTAGNPPEYNDSVREFDIVTWDRLKRIDVEENFETWKKYAINKGVSSAIISYLDIKQENFYKIETTVDGKRFITARGWIDLSDMMNLYEINNFEITYDLISQYVQDSKIAKDFALYYDLYKKYKSDYEIEKILQAKQSSDISNRAKNAKIDERIALVYMLFECNLQNCKNLINQFNINTLIQNKFKLIKKELNENNFKELIEKNILELQEYLDKKQAQNSLSKEDKIVYKKSVEILEKMLLEVDEKAIDTIKEVNKVQKKELESEKEKVKNQIDNVIKFLVEALGEDKEIIIYITELTANQSTSWCINKLGSDEYFKYNSHLLVTDKKVELLNMIESLDLEEI